MSARIPATPFARGYPRRFTFYACHAVALAKVGRSSHSLHSYFLLALSRIRAYRATAEFLDRKLTASGERK
jgi:hypothetical protein